MRKRALSVLLAVLMLQGSVLPVTAAETEEFGDAFSQGVMDLGDGTDGNDGAGISDAAENDASEEATEAAKETVEVTEDIMAKRKSLP